MRSYELTYLALPELPESEIENIQKEIESFLEEKRGFLEKKGKSTRKKILTYADNINSALLVSFNFQLNPEELKNLEKKLEDNKQIFRFIISSRKEIKEKPELVSALPKKIPTEKKVELTEIEKKLDEILGET